MLRCLRHSAVVWGDHISEDDDFTGIMLSSKGPNTYPENLVMKQEHFLQGFFNKTHFVNQRFIKFSVWGSFEKVGALTKEGINFIEGGLSLRAALPFDHYRP